MKPFKLLFFLFILFTSCNNYGKRTKSCEEVKYEAINYFRDHIDEIEGLILREIERGDNNEITAEKVIDGIQTLSIGNKLNEYQDFLKNNCTAKYEEYNSEIAGIIIGVIINRIGKQID